MPKLNVYNLEAKEIREIELAEAVFGIEPNQQVMFDALIMQRANMRQGTHDTKSRQEALASEGHRPCSSGFHPRSAVERRRHRFRSDAAQLCLPSEPQGPPVGFEIAAF